MHNPKTVAIEFKNPSKLLTVTYVVSLSIIALLSVVVHIMLDKVIAEQSDTGYIVNLSGQQRMLSQRTSLFAIEYATGGDPQSKQLAEASLARMRANHNQLLAGHYLALEKGLPSPLSDTLLQMYFSDPLNVDAKLTQFANQVTQALTRPVNFDAPPENLGFLELARQPLLLALHTVVEQYERESVEKVNDLRFAQNVVLGIIIFTILVEALFVFRPMVAKISRFAIRLQQDANFDPLSGLLNRRAFDLLAVKAVAFSNRHKRPLGVVIADIDRFKTINDHHGHGAGDQAIKHAATVIAQSCRESDIVARIGGEEFAVLLPDTDKQGAAQVAEKIRQHVQDQTFCYEGQVIPFTLSAGVAELDEAHPGIEQPLHVADEALYQSKQAGRNRVTVA